MCVGVAVSADPSSSWPALTVTICAVFQLSTVKVSVVLSSVRSVPSCPEMVTMTVSEGCVASLTV